MRFPWLALLCLLTPIPAAARPYTLDDMLRLESYGQVLVDPTGRWAVVERRDRFDGATDYRYDWHVRRLLSKLLVADLKARTTARPLFAQEAKAGYWAGDFSPSGKRLSVFRLAENRLQLGVLDMASQAIRWLPVVPDLPDAHPAPLWVDDDHLVLVTLEDGGLPDLLRAPTNAQRFATLGWERTAQGREAASTTLGSGRFLDEGASYRARKLVTIDLASGAQRRLFDGDLLDLALSSDRRRIAVLAKGPPVQPDPHERVDPAFEPRRQRLTVVDLLSGTAQQPCPGCDILPSLLHWAGTDPRLLFYARRDGTSWAQGQVFVWDGSRGTTTTPVPQGLHPLLQIAGGSARFLPAGWAGGSLIVFAERTGDKRRDWYRLDGRGRASRATAAFPIAPSALVAATSTYFYAGDARGLWRGNWGGVIRRVASGGLRAGRPVLLDGHSLGTRLWVNALPRRVMALLGTGEAARSLVEDDGGKLHAEPAAPGQMLLAATPAGALIRYQEDAQGVGAVALTDHGRTTLLDRVNTHLAEVTAPRRILLHSRAADGTLRNHWLLLPPEGKTPPRLVVVPYPGISYGDTPPPDSQPASPTLMTHPLLLVGQGYAVLRPSLPLADAPSEPLPGIAAAMEGAIDAALASGLVAPEKPFLVGHSYGGYTVLGMAAVTDRFAAVVAADGIYDLASAYGAMDPRADYGENGISLTIPVGWAEGGQGRMGVPPWSAVERYARNSPFYHIEAIHVPVMLATSDLDYVSAGQAERMFLALYRLGKDAVLLRYRGEGHSLISPANLRDYWSHLFAFLSKQQASKPVN